MKRSFLLNFIVYYLTASSLSSIRFSLVTQKIPHPCLCTYEHLPNSFILFCLDFDILRVPVAAPLLSDNQHAKQLHLMLHLLWGRLYFISFCCLIRHHHHTETEGAKEEVDLITPTIIATFHTSGRSKYVGAWFRQREHQQQRRRQSLGISFCTRDRVKEKQMQCKNEKITLSMLQPFRWDFLGIVTFLPQ